MESSEESGTTSSHVIIGRLLSSLIAPEASLDDECTQKPTDLPNIKYHEGCVIIVQGEVLDKPTVLDNPTALDRQVLENETTEKASEVLMSRYFACSNAEFEDCDAESPERSQRAISSSATSDHP